MWPCSDDPTPAPVALDRLRQILVLARADHDAGQLDDAMYSEVCRLVAECATATQTLLHPWPAHQQFIQDALTEAGAHQWGVALAHLGHGH
ncbi:MAG: hypothetical protein ACC662_05365 [Planctomycetota bacterium]